MRLDFAKSACDASGSFNASDSNVNDVDPKLCCVFEATTCYEMNHDASIKKVCPTIQVALQYYFCVILTSATAERSFSTMRRVKNYLRSASESVHLIN